MINRTFHRLIRKRGITVQFLADAIDSGRPHVTEVLNNVPGHGGRTRRRLFLWLLPEEIAALGWTVEYEAWLREPLREQISPINSEPTERSVKTRAVQQLGGQSERGGSSPTPHAESCELHRRKRDVDLVGAGIGPAESAGHTSAVLGHCAGEDNSTHRPARKRACGETPGKCEGTATGADAESAPVSTEIGTLCST